MRLYNAQDQLVYQERLENLCLNLSKATTRCQRMARQLDVALQQVLHDSASATQTATLLAAKFDQNRRVQRTYAVR